MKKMKILSVLLAGSIVFSGFGASVVSAYTIDGVEVTEEEYWDYWDYWWNMNGDPNSREDDKDKVKPNGDVDVNNDGKIDTTDALVVLQIVTGLISDGREEPYLANYDKGEILTADHALAILEYVVGLPDVADCGKYFEERNMV